MASTPFVVCVWKVFIVVLASFTLIMVKAFTFGCDTQAQPSYLPMLMPLLQQKSRRT